MIFINNLNTNVYFNLAAEEHLLKNLSENIFILYQNEPSVIVGKYQDVRAEINLDFAKENNIKIARRISGGGAVFHDMGNLNLVFIENNPHPDFRKYTTQILEFLSGMGIYTKTDERSSIIINDLKISGCAQYIYKNRILHHATLLYSADLKKLNAVLDNYYNPIVSKRTFVKSVKSPVTNLVEYLEDPVDIVDFRQMVFDYFFDKDAENTIYSFNKEDISNIDFLKTNRYMTSQWIFNA